ncbi:MAG: carboxypeptidase regulatory-like domain-containing protein [Blastocatellia bacterium]|jgi:hypothetical protein|nr:carboxypeptidase regulatory-like domain-containing protein [Blastocatellia bacterium]
MTDPNRLLNDIRIATPCTANWDQMTGTDTVRFCGECKLNVYNISGMQAKEAARLVESAEGRLCVRLYKKTDGTVLTQNCPVGVRAAMRRATRAAGAALTAALGIFAVFSVRSAAAGDGQQCEKPNPTVPQVLQGGFAPPRQHQVKMGKIALPRRRGESVLVNVRDESGIKLIGAEVVLTNPETGEAVIADQEAPGLYRFDGVEPGVYTISVTANGFTNPLPRSLRVRAGKQASVAFTLESGEVRVLLGEMVAPQR